MSLLEKFKIKSFDIIITLEIKYLFHKMTFSSGPIY
jgi:hypothetical protein